MTQEFVSLTFRNGNLSGILAYDDLRLADKELRVPIIIGNESTLHDWDSIDGFSVLGFGRSNYSLSSYLPNDWSSVEFEIFESHKKSKLTFGKDNADKGLVLHQKTDSVDWKFKMDSIFIGSSLQQDPPGLIVIDTGSIVTKLPTHVFAHIEHNYLSTSECFKANEKTAYDSEDYLCVCNGGPPSVLPDILIVIDGYYIDFKPKEYVLSTFMEEDIAYCRLGLKPHSEDEIILGVKFAIEHNFILNFTDSYIQIMNASKFTMWTIVSTTSLAIGAFFIVFLIGLIIYSTYRRKRRSNRFTLKKEMKTFIENARIPDSETYDPRVLAALIQRPSDSP